MKVVSNSSCLIALSSSDLLYILKKLFGKVLKTKSHNLNPLLKELP